MNEKEFYENLSNQLLSEIEKEREGQAKLLSELNNNLKMLLEAQEQERNAILSRMQSLEFGLAELSRALERTRRHLAGLRELTQSICGAISSTIQTAIQSLGNTAARIEANNDREQEKRQQQQSQNVYEQPKAEIEEHHHTRRMRM